MPTPPHHPSPAVHRRPRRRRELTARSLGSVLATAIFGLATAGRAQSIPATELILPPTEIEHATFGNRISVEGDWMAVSADHDAGPLAVGRVHLYRRSGESWTHHQELTAPDGHAGDHFGMPVELRDDRLLVGMPWDDDRGNRAGAVHVFRLVDDTWTWTQKLLPATHDDTGARFGTAISFGETVDEVLVGAFLESIDADTAGGVWVFRDTGDGYEVVQRLSIGQPAGYFGRAIDVENGVLAVGAPGTFTEVGWRHGGVAIHHRENGLWVLIGVLLPANPEPYQVFGECLDLEADRLAVGSPFEDTFGVAVGAVHVYRMIDGLPWLDETFGPDDPTNVSGFGFPCRFDPDGDRLAIGAYATTANGAAESGAAWLRERIDGVWTASARLVPQDTRPRDFFGLSAAFDGDRILIGSPRRDGAATDAGGVIGFRMRDCDASGDLDVWEIAAGVVADLNEDGVPDECQNPIGDLNGDGVVDGADIGLFSTIWGTDGGGVGDVNGDGIVDGADLALILAGW